MWEILANSLWWMQFCCIKKHYSWPKFLLWHMSKEVLVLSSYTATQVFLLHPCQQRCNCLTQAQPCSYFLSNYFQACVACDTMCKKRGWFLRKQCPHRRGTAQVSYSYKTCIYDPGAHKIIPTSHSFFLMW